MKKLMCVFAAAAMAVGVHGAEVLWSSGVFETPSGGSSYTGSKYSDVYTAVFTVYSDAAGTDVLGSDSSSTVKKAGNLAGSIDMTAPAEGVTKTYYTKLVITEKATGKQLESTIGSFTWTGGDLATPDVTFYGDGAGGFAPGGAPSASPAGWAAAPEPTSGLLLLIGAGMLALRRKQK